MELRIRNYLYGFILKLMGYGQSLFWIPVSACILRIPEKYQKYRYARISQHFYGLKNL
jgi:hypothetical protein